MGVSMPTPRSFLAAGVANGILHAVGGYYFNSLATLEAYDPVSDSWTTKASTPTARYGLGAGVSTAFSTRSAGLALPVVLCWSSMRTIQRPTRGRGRRRCLLRGGIWLLTWSTVFSTRLGAFPRIPWRLSK